MSKKKCLIQQQELTVLFLQKPLYIILIILICILNSSNYGNWLKLFLSQNYEWSFKRCKMISSFRITQEKNLWFIKNTSNSIDYNSIFLITYQVFFCSLWLLLVRFFPLKLWIRYKKIQNNFLFQSNRKKIFFLNEREP